MKKSIISGIAGLLLAGTAFYGFRGWRAEHRKVVELETQIKLLQKQEMRSTIDRSVSLQMEEIANEQREISDEKREEALQQTLIANEMRLQSERERQNALEAERNAVASEKKALEASDNAERQRLVAEHQRIQAEFSKRVADTLSYIALARSLGSISTIQFQAGNNDIADLLSYASYLYTARFNGDIYNPAVFQSLMQSSQSINTWSEHAGAVMRIEFLPDEINRFVSVSNYGEILLSERRGTQLHTKALFKDSNYDFRDVLISNSGKIYAVSRMGQLVVVNKDLKTVKSVPLPETKHPMRLHNISETNLLVIGENSIALVNTKNNTVKETKQLPFRVITVARKNKLPLLFDDQGRMHLLAGLEDFTTERVPVSGKVSAYCESKNTGVEAYGMTDGTIYLTDRNGKIQKLIGHLSRISNMKMNGRRLYSASYDGSVKLWITDKEKIEPMEILQTSNWIMHFNFDATKNTFWFGDVKGNLTAVNVSVPIMVDTVKKKLKRDLTNEEWNYFIGQNVPYESFIGNEK